MKNRDYHLYLTDTEYSRIVAALINLKNDLIAQGRSAEAYLVSFPREGDVNYDGQWGHGSLNFMNGWKGLETKRTNAYAINSYTGKVCYCIEPGTPLAPGDNFVSATLSVC